VCASMCTDTCMHVLLDILICGMNGCVARK